MNQLQVQTDVLSIAEQRDIRNVDRLLPSQPVMRKLFRGADDSFHHALESMLLSVLPAEATTPRGDVELKAGVSYASLGSDIGTLHFYQFLIELCGIRSVLELGTYVGVSTLYLAQAVGERGRITTVEKGEEFYAIAERNFQRSEMKNRIRLLCGDALSVLGEFAAAGLTFDLVLIDAAKEDYAKMLAPALRCLVPGGLLIVDDIFMNGDSLNGEPVTAKGRGVRQLLAQVKALPPQAARVILPIGNGTLLLRKSALNPVPAS